MAPHSTRCALSCRALLRRARLSVVPAPRDRSAPRRRDDAKTSASTAAGSAARKMTLCAASHGPSTKAPAASPPSRAALANSEVAAEYARLAELWAAYRGLAKRKAPVEERALREELVITAHELPDFYAIEGQGHLTFLFRPYAPRFFYWEVAESLRRLVLGSVLVIAYPGKLTQIAIGAIVSFLLALFHAKSLPASVFRKFTPSPP